MDKECASLLPQVCEVLLDSGSSLPDDTSLEKLLDWFSGLIESGEGGALLEAHPCLLEFISAVVHKPSSDPSVISFALKVCGLVAAAEDAFKMLQARFILDLAFNHQHWHRAGLWEDPCVRVGWIQGLRKMLQHSEALHFFVQADLISELLQLQTDSSLFVVSAANQLLAHILLFFQPAFSTRRNGVHMEHRDDMMSHARITETDQPEVHTETSKSYAAVVVTILEYLNESLVTKDNSQLRQSRQILKVLVLLLAQAGPFLRDQLLQSVTDSLEELVTAGYSQLTLPLMDVILAAHSSLSPDECVPDQRMGRLLSSMLNVNKPSDLIHAAAAVLHRGHQDTVHTARAVRILLLPLDIITGHTLLGTNTADEEHRCSMAKQLKSKTSCISLICVCLTNAPHVTLMPADVLPCPPCSIVGAVVSLLSICNGCVSSSSSGHAEVFRNVIGSSKVQKCALEAVTRLSSSPGVKDELTEVFTVLIRYLSNPDSDRTVIHKSYQALVKWTIVCKDLSSIKDQLRQDLTDVVKKRVCDMRWEVRDSTVEFLGQLAGVLKSPEVARDTSEALLDSCCCLTLLREALRDPESYVRASTIAALGQTLAHSWQQGAALTEEQTDVVNQLLEILSQDTEGFARRAVMQYFLAWFSSCASHTSPPSSSRSSLLMSSLSSVLSLGTADLDWEVKVHSLELAELLLDEAFSGCPGYRKPSERPCASLHPYAVVSDQTYAVHRHTPGVESDLSGVLNNLVKQGVVSALLSGLVDCDRPVGLKACQLLISLREAVGPPSKDEVNATPTTAAVTKVTCEVPSCGWGKEIRRILGMKTCDEDEETDLTADECGDTRKQGKGEGGRSVSVSVREMLRSLGLDARLDILSQSSDHVHNSPLSLLQDIVMSSATHTQANTQPGQEVIVDCY
ncbi:BRCA1-associated ATM activator 1 isoform X1 [Solea solea]|uniref:BRCA1-associated ATM activator 1 isoform X1 n=1 Tax=Solea solea TaxID=90069 RepID=UPI002729C254|nr:BRCA1-associated ATM activator 1 isoform X1 [Solea solea]